MNTVMLYILEGVSKGKDFTSSFGGLSARTRKHREEEKRKKRDVTFVIFV